MPNNCVGPTIPVTGCCQGCNSQLQENCPCQACSPVSVQCTADINNAVCVPILAEQIYDCVTIEKEQCSYLTGVTFNIAPATSATGTAITYSTTAPICITGVGITYDFIGLVAGSTGVSGTAREIAGVTAITSIIVDGTTQTLTPENVRVCENEPGTADTAQIGLFNQATSTVTRTGCCCNQVPGQTSSRARVIERGLNFWVCGLNVTISGVIGCDPFTATSTISEGADIGGTTISNPIPLAPATGFDADNTNLGFDPITFCGRVCMPISATNINLNENFDTCLQVDCVNADTAVVAGTVGAQTLTADVELTFAVTKQIVATLQQQMAVFTTPDAVICTNSPITPCGNVTQQ